MLHASHLVSTLHSVLRQQSTGHSSRTSGVESIVLGIVYVREVQGVTVRFRELEGRMPEGSMVKLTPFSIQMA